MNSVQLGGYLSCNCIEDDVYFTYGCYYGTRIKIIIILKNFQSKEVEDVLKVIFDFGEKLLGCKSCS